MTLPVCQHEYVSTSPPTQRDRPTRCAASQITDIQESDQGTYECRVQISVQESISGTVLLAVRLKPVISDNSTRSAQTPRPLSHCSLPTHSGALGHPHSPLPLVDIRHRHIVLASFVATSRAATGLMLCVDDLCWGITRKSQGK